MLKSAAEMAAAARTVKEEAANLERANRKEEASRAAELREEAARLDQAHRVFDHQAIAAARTGQLGLAVSGVELSLDRLRKQSFAAERLTRRESFEKHLASLVNGQTEQLVHICDRIVSKCPSLNRIGGDDFLHRNPLISLMETLRRRGELKEPFDVELLFAFVRVLSAVNSADLESVRQQMCQALQTFADLKEAEAKYIRVRWENETIPQEASEATYVTWESADDGQGLVVAFSAQRLKWLATRWTDLAATLGTRISEDAQGGRSNLTVFVWRTTGTWNLSWDWPPDAWMVDDEPEAQDLQSATDSTWGGDLFCDPKLAADELILAGYEVMIEPLAVGDASRRSLAETYLAERSGEAYALTIRWS